MENIVTYNTHYGNNSLLYNGGNGQQGAKFQLVVLCLEEDRRYLRNGAILVL